MENRQWTTLEALKDSSLPLQEKNPHFDVFSNPHDNLNEEFHNRYGNSTPYSSIFQGRVAPCVTPYVDKESNNYDPIQRPYVTDGIHSVPCGSDKRNVRHGAETFSSVDNSGSKQPFDGETVMRPSDPCEPQHFGPYFNAPNGSCNVALNTKQHNEVSCYMPPTFKEFYRNTSSKFSQHYNHRFEGHHTGDYSRERKFAKKIYVDGLFPPHIRPASVLIGTRGMNHHRMQSSGCIIQLRGKGCSQPTSQWSEEPIHLYVKYDTDAQFSRFERILNDIVQGCKDENNSKRTRWESPGSRAVYSPSRLHPLKSVANKAQIALEVDLLWLLRAFFASCNTVFLDELFEQMTTLFGLDVLQNHIKSEGAHACKDHLLQFVASCTHCFNLTLERASNVQGTENVAPWTRTRVSFNSAVASVTKNELYDFHQSFRRGDGIFPQRESVPSNADTVLYFSNATVQGHPWKTNPYSEHQERIPSPLELLVQGLHFVIQECTEQKCLVSHLEELFHTRFDIPLDVSCFNFSSVLELVKAFPSVFYTSGFSNNVTVHTIANPIFHSTEPRNSVVKGDNTMVLPSQPASARFQQEPTDACTTERDQSSTPPVKRRIPPWQEKVGSQYMVVKPSSMAAPDTKGMNQSTPRLLGLLGRLVEQTPKVNK